MTDRPVVAVPRAQTDQPLRLGSGRSVTLVMFSGGIDSTHLLWHLLTETDDVVLAHHVHLINAERRHPAEARACKAIVTHLKDRHRDFFYTESAVDRSRFKVFGTDVITVAAEGGIAASNFLADTGVMPQRWTLGINAEEAAEVSDHAVKRLPFVLAAMSASTWPNTPPRYFRPAIKPKAQLIAEIGDDLASLCWTCRRPVWADDGAWRACGKCKTCTLMREIDTGHSKQSADA